MIRILSIGNSFSQDAQRWLHQIAAAAGEELLAVNLCIGGCSLERHAGNVINDAAAYTYEVNGEATGRMASVREVLEEERWDAVTIQQVSQLAGRPQTFLPHILTLAELIRVKAPQARLYFHETWAYETDSDHPGFSYYDRNQKEMLRRIIDAAALAQQLTGALLLPSGELIQYLRETMPEFAYGSGGLSLNRDGFHLSLDYGRYAVAALWLCALTGKFPADNGFVPETGSEAVKQEILNGINHGVVMFCREKGIL